MGLSHGKALIELLPWNLLWIHNDGEGVRGQAEAGAEICSRKQAPLGLGVCLPHLPDVVESVNHPAHLFRVAEEVARVRDQSALDVLRAGCAIGRTLYRRK